MQRILINKLASKEYAQVGDNVVYTNIIKNVGVEDIESILFSDEYLVNTIFISGSLKINNNTVNANPFQTISLNSLLPQIFPLKPNESIVITYTVSIDSILDTPILSTTSTVEYTYLENATLKTANEISNKVSVIVRYGELVLDKKSDTDILEIGDEINYSIDIENIGNIAVQSIVIKDSFAAEYEFLEGSIVTDSGTSKISKIDENIKIDSIEAGEKVIIKLKAKLIRLSYKMEISNTAVAEYKVLINPKSSYINKISESNTLIAKLAYVNITMFKNATPGIVNIGDEIKYSITIKNNSDFKIDNIKLYDEISDSTSLVELYYDDIKITDIDKSNLLSGVDIGSLESNKMKVIYIKVKVINVDCSLEIKNKSSIEYDYYLENGLSNRKRTISNESIVKISDRSFRQVFSDGVVQIPSQKPDISEIMDLNVSTLIDEYEVIDTPIGTSEEGQILTGKKLVVCATLCIKVIYESNKLNQAIHSAHFEIPICEYIVINKEVESTCGIKPEILIEDIYYNKINEREVFYNITYLTKTCI